MTTKMMGVIYRAFKENKLPNTTTEDIENGYNLVKELNSEVGGWELRAYHKQTVECIEYLKNAVDAIFKGDYEEADSITRNIRNISKY